jgi:putative membrane protein
MEAEVERAAFTHFFTEGLHTTREATGVLIFLSVLERRVWILGDRGINARIQPKSWQEFVDRLTAGIRDNHRCDALCRVIGEIGEVLADRFPPRTDDRNELEDLVIVTGTDPGPGPGGRLIIR